MRQPRWRRKRLQNMKAAGITPVERQQLWIVSLEKWNLLPAWLHSKLFFPRHPIPGQFWLRHYDALGLMVWAKTIHVGYSYAITEFKRCPVCRRPTVGSEAEALRAKMEKTADRSTIVCGPNCAKDAESKLWTRTTEVAA